MKNIVKAPPSKSISHRALMCAALANGESIVKNVLIADDTKRTMDCLKALGAKIDFISHDSVKIKGISESYSKKNIELNVGESGTTCRLIIPIVAALKDMEVRIYGTGRMHDRPVDDLTDALIKLGCDITFEQKKGYPPLKINAKGLDGAEVDINIEKSSQYLSGLLLAAPLCSSQMDINISGNKAVSWPYVGLTIFVMEKFGVKVNIYEKENGENWVLKKITEIKDVIPGKIKFRISKAQYTPTEFFVEGDFSNASYLIAAGILLDSGLKIYGLNKNSLQGDRKIIDILQQMGAKIYWDGDILICEKSHLKGIEINMKDCPDLVPTVGVMATLAQGKSVIKGVEHLRIKESDRLLGVAQEIKKVGAKVFVFEDGLEIDPVDVLPHKEIYFLTYNDHRMAMSMSLYELVNIRVKLDNRDCVAKSFPEFFNVFNEIKKLK